MKRKSFALSLLAIVPLLFAVSVHSQVIVKLFQPQPNQWNVADMWNLTLTNTSSKAIKVYLHGTVEAQSDGLIFEGKSAVFSLPANYSGRIDPRQLEPADVGYANSDYEEIVLRTGTMPEGIYTICITVKDAETDEELGRGCVVQPITSISPPQLLNPEDEAELTEPLPVFTWLPPTPLTGNYSVSYSLRIVEFLDGQVPLEAMEANPAWFTEKNIPSTSFQLPISARPMEPGRKYAWQVTAYGNKYEIGKSEVWSFTLEESQCNVVIDSVVVTCNGIDGMGSDKYKVTVYFRNRNTNCTSYLGIPNPTGYGAQPPTFGSPYLQIVQGAATISNVVPSGAGILSPGNTTITMDIANPIPNLINLPLIVNIKNGAICAGIGSDCTDSFTIDSLPPCRCHACDTTTNPEFPGQITWALAQSSTLFNAVNNNTLILTQPLSVTPYYIMSLNADIINFRWYSRNSDCKKCNVDDFYWGTLARGIVTDNEFTTLGSPPSDANGPIQNSRAMFWQTINYPDQALFNGNVKLVISLPPQTQLNCCKDCFEFCVRFSVTFVDADDICKTCSIIRCYKAIRPHFQTLYGYTDECGYPLISNLDQDLEIVDPGTLKGMKPQQTMIIDSNGKIQYPGIK